jgi:hypothetical protein
MCAAATAPFGCMIHPSRLALAIKSSGSRDGFGLTRPGALDCRGIESA